MKKIVGVRFRKPGKIYFFDPENFEIEKGQKVIVETSQGQEIGEATTGIREVHEETLKAPLKKVVRIATKKDIRNDEENRKKEKEAFEICQQKIKKHKLDMNLLDVEYKFDNSKILFFFTADGRIDFRELVKDLAAVFKTRIELRQIGVRDEVKRIGGNGVCGRELCCCSFLGNFETVSIKMAKEQNISLNPSKISGNCGRLMCCLKYEQDVYEDGEGIVESIETLKEIIRVKLKDGDETFYKKFNAKDVTLIKSPENEEEDPEEKEHLKELQELEKLEKMDTQNKTDDDI